MVRGLITRSLVILLTVSFTACMRWEMAPGATPSLSVLVANGDEVRFTLADGQRVTLRHPRITDDGIRGEPTALNPGRTVIAVKDVALVLGRQLDRRKTSVAVMASAFGAVVVAFLVAWGIAS